MKVIDLLNKIANGEELPRKLKGNNHTYTGIEDLNYQLCNYQDEDGDILFSDDYEWCSQRILNKELEIIEEEKDIEEILDIELLGQCDNWLQHQETEEKSCLELNPYILGAITRNFKLLYNKQCELIREVNKLKNKE